MADDVEKKGSPRKVERLLVTKAGAGQAGRSALHHAGLRRQLRVSSAGLLRVDRAVVAVEGKLDG